MKTLNEQIAEIKAAKTSKAAKKQALIKLGITNYEINLILEGVECATSSRTSFTFGVEIECGVERGAIGAAAAQTGMPYQYQGYNHNDGHAYFKFTTDGSLSLPNAIECVSPVLKGANGKKMLKNACDTLNKAGARVNRTCGLHVHVGAKTLTDKQFANVFANYYHLESVIDTFMAPSRRANNNCYCQSVRDHAELQYATTFGGVYSALHDDRYHKINPMSYFRHKTIEFRQYQGTTDFEKIFNWVSFCGKLVWWSKKNRLTADIATIDEIPFLNKKEKEFFKNRAITLG